MKYSGLYHINNPTTNLDASLNTVNALIQGIETTFQNITRLPPWSLSYKLFRDTIPPKYQPLKDADGKPQPFAHTFQHLLHHSSLAQNRAYVCIQPPAQHAAVTSVLLQQQDAHTSIVRQQMAALWTARHIVSIPQGTSYRSGICTIQVGELRAIREGLQSGAAQSPGVVVCITTTVGEEDADENTDVGNLAVQNDTATADEDEPDFDYAQAIIRDCWNNIKEGRDLGRFEIREVMMAPSLTTAEEREREAAVRMWCDILRLRGPTTFDGSYTVLSGDFYTKDTKTILDASQSDDRRDSTQGELNRAAAALLNSTYNPKGQGISPPQRVAHLGSL